MLAPNQPSGFDSAAGQDSGNGTESTAAGITTGPNPDLSHDLYVIRELLAIQEMAKAASEGSTPFEFMGRRLTPRSMTTMIQLRVQMLVRYLGHERIE